LNAAIYETGDGVSRSCGCGLCTIHMNTWYKF